MDTKKTYLISDASKKVEVESHVLRYWEDELKLPVKRNELGHRYYTEEDIRKFREIKQLKEQGLQLKAIRMILKDGKLTRLEDMVTLGGLPEEKEEKKEESAEKEPETTSLASPKAEYIQTEQDEADKKARRLQFLMKRLISEVVQENNQKLYEDISASLLKELDYQFRMQEEREEQRENRQMLLEEEHYKQLDALLRGRSAKKKPEKKTKKIFPGRNKE